jgi:hypothetical protein
VLEPRDTFVTLVVLVCGAGFWLLDAGSPSRLELPCVWRDDISLPIMSVKEGGAVQGEGRVSVRIERVGRSVKLPVWVVAVDEASI